MASVATASSLSTHSAATAVIKFLGQPCGYLQDFNLDENYNTVRVKEIGTPSDAAHVAGFLEMTLTARRAFIDANLFISLMGTVDRTAMRAAGIGDDNTISIAKLVTAFTNASYPIKRGAIPTTISFDIDVQGLNSDPTAEDSYVSLYTLNSCTFVTRRSSLTTGNIIIYEDCTLFPKYKTVHNTYTSVVSVPTT
jgi:hypothetical protein